MYWFIYGNSPEYIEKIVGAKVSDNTEGPKVIFMNAGKLVSVETEPWELESRQAGDVSFDDFPDRKYYRSYGPDASFIVKKADAPGGVAYDLVSVGGYREKN
jgi:hypothetical protein